ncbi:3-keto-disaccharide hydrolase [Portibacter lacus]|uniref:3-keto-alpha-glucoside-1,2-lyase/3-keto-2-hydroxy-glucal hydratase domain-containing protein n=1 Tax=Portibacter lacus TaxID=1099794 RepID=A0AA37SLI4_9BACT|nr:DUF1080 domain-containing protein [Portibacter lacus]GLR16411.1 hypothetical protein GCM10007940_10260 [Portibacter lacus]
MRTILLFSFLIFSCTGQKTLPKMDEVSEWVDLFNGVDLDGWTTKIHHYETGDNFGDTFRAEDGMIKVRYDQYGDDFNNRFAHLYTNKSYSHFHLIMEYRFVGEVCPGTPSYAYKNSGVMYHSQDPKTMLKEQDWPISVEMQFLAGMERGKERPTGNMCSPGTNIVFEGELDPRHCIESSSDTYFGDQWVKAELIVRGDSLITHIINGENVLEYSKPQIGGGVANGYDPSIKIDGKLLTEGHIALQSEGQPIDFRNIMIRELK